MVFHQGNEKEVLDIFEKWDLPCSRIGEVTGDGLLRFFAGGRGCFALLGGREFHSGAARFGQPDGDGLLGRTRSVLSFAHVIDLFMNKFTGLCTGRFPCFGVLTRALDGFLLGHAFSFFVSGRSRRRLLSLQFVSRNPKRRGSGSALTHPSRYTAEGWQAPRR